jgi:phosphate-selective porin OprO and OprP
VFPNIKFKKHLIISIGIVFSLTCLPVHATNDAMLDLLKILVKKGSLTQEEYDLLLTAAKADGNKVESDIKEVKTVVTAKTKDLPKVTTKGKIKIESADGDWAFQPIGRIMWDQIWTDDDGSTAEDSGTELRRARLGFQAKFMKVFKSKLELDFATSGNASWKDVWISYNGKTDYGKWFVKLGQSHMPFGHATISSSKYMPLMRRPLFGDGPQQARNVGVALRHDSDRWFVHGGVFRPGISTTNDEIGDAGTGDDSIFYSGRIGGTPYFKDKKHLIHVGVSAQHQNVNGDSFSNIDNSLITHIGSGSTLDANFGTNTESVNSFDLEAITVWGPFHAVGEYVYWSVDDPDGDADLNAWAIDAGYFLTGESMKYKKGQFSGIGPKYAVDKGGIGAWQVAIRLENMDLNDGAAITGGEADVFTAGLNWIPVKNVRFMANYATVLDYDRTGNANDGLEPSAFSMRGQVYW